MAPPRKGVVGATPATRVARCRLDVPEPLDLGGRPGLDSRNGTPHDVLSYVRTVYVT